MTHHEQSEQVRKLHEICLRYLNEDMRFTYLGLLQKVSQWLADQIFNM